MEINHSLKNQNRHSTNPNSLVSKVSQSFRGEQYCSLVRILDIHVMPR